jgi:hypothetical protein
MRYINVDDVQNNLELGVLDEINEPKLSVVKSWIDWAEEYIDERTEIRWDYHNIDNELLTPIGASDTFLLKDRPLITIESIYYQNGDEWTTNWVLLSSSDYRIVNANISKIKTKNLYYKTEALKISYTAGYKKLPHKVKDLALLLVQKKYLSSRILNNSADTDVVSVAVIRIQDKTNSSLNVQLKQLDPMIEQAFSKLRLTRPKAFYIGNVSCDESIKRDRWWGGW